MLNGYVQGLRQVVLCTCCVGSHCGPKGLQHCDSLLYVTLNVNASCDCDAQRLLEQL